MLKLRRPESTEVLLDLRPHCSVDLEDHVVGLVPDVSVLVLVAHQRVLQALLVVDVVLANWVLLDYLVQQLQPALNVLQ